MTLGFLFRFNPLRKLTKKLIVYKWNIVLNKNRELQREFDVLLLEARGSKTKIKECRKQSVIYGFEQCYKNNKFKDILILASRLDQKIIENDSEIAEFIEVAEMKEEGF